METKTQKILTDLLAGLKISSLEALKRYRVMRLSDHIYLLKKEGYDIQKRLEVSRSGTRYAVYFIPETVEARDNSPRGLV